MRAVAQIFILVLLFYHQHFYENIALDDRTPILNRNKQVKSSDY